MSVLWAKRGWVRLGLLGSATAYLNGVQPYHWFDFVNDRALYAGVDVGAVSGATGYSFTRASDGTYRNLDGTTTTFTSGALRRGDRGVLIEGARTNLFLNSATGATQSVTVTASAHTLSFEGTGTVTLTGVSTAGPLIGTGALNRVSLTFTPTAGTLTLTISGTVERVNLEAGVFGSSWIPTTGASATRAADDLYYTAGVTYPLSFWAEIERVVDASASPVQLGVLQVDASAKAQRAFVSIVNAPTHGFRLITRGGANDGDVVGSTVPIDVFTRAAARVEADKMQVAVAGTLATEDTTASVPTSAPDALRVGDVGVASQHLFGYIRRAAVFNSSLTDAQLQTVAT